jgi:hypothetical protein
VTRQEATDLLDRYLVAMGPTVAAVYDEPEREMMIKALLLESEYPKDQDRSLTRFVHSMISGNGTVGVGGVN